MFEEILLGFAGSGCFFAVWMSAAARRRVPETVNWPSVRGVVTKSKKIEGIPHTGKPDSTDFEYEYEIGGENFKGSSLKLYDGPYDHQWTHSKYPVGLSIKVYYDPNNNNISILEPGWESDTFGPSIFGALLFWLSRLIIAGVGVLAFVIAFSDG